jgi:hypothetical protein
MNEPVAWIDPRELDMAVSTSVTKNKQFDTDIPLYTHPAKTLTDEEIIETVKDHFIGAIKLGIVLTNDNVLDFARAILRKAQEK